MQPGSHIDTNAHDPGPKLKYTTGHNDAEHIYAKIKYHINLDLLSALMKSLSHARNAT